MLSKVTTNLSFGVKSLYKDGLSFWMHSLGWTCTKLAILPFLYVNLTGGWLDTPCCCFILSLSNRTLWFLLLTSSSCCKRSPNPRFDLSVPLPFPYFGDVCEEGVIHAVLHTQLKTQTNEREREKLNLCELISVFLFFYFHLNICVWMYVYMWDICTHSHICVCILGLNWCLVLHVDCGFCLF